MAARQVTLINNFTGGANGLAIAPGNSGGPSGSPWDTATTGPAVTYDNSVTARYGEGFSARVATTTSAACYLGWAASMLPAGSTSQAQVWFRVCLYFTTAPPAPVTVFLASVTAGTCASVQVNVSGTVSALDAGGTVRCTTTNTVPSGRWVRLEGTVVGDPSAGSVSVQLYPATSGDPYAHDSTILATGNSASASGLNTRGPMTGWRFGQGVAAASIGPYWMADPGLSNAGALGPALYGFAPIRVDDGGAVTQLALTGTYPGGQLACGGDVEGFFTSADNGQHWQVSNTGVYGIHWRRVASIAWSQFEGNTIYACTGLNGAAGGFMVGTVSAAGVWSWAMRSTAVQYSGNTTNITGDPSRSAGGLLAQAGTVTAPVLYTATYNGGVFRSKSATPGTAWSNIGLGGGSHFGRGIAVDPANKDNLYVSMYGEGVYFIGNASTASPSAPVLMAGSPAHAEQMVFCTSGTLYVAAGSQGVFSWDGTNWNQIGGTASSPLSSSSYWMAIDGYTDASGNDQLIAGCQSPVQYPQPSANKGYRTLMWVTVTTGANVFTDLTASLGAIQDAYVPPDSGRSWWHTAKTVPNPSQATGYAEWLGGHGYFQPHPVIDRSTINTTGVVFYVAGAGGVYISTGNTVGATGPYSTASGSGSPPQWQVAVNGMPAYIGHQVVVDPSNPLHLAWATRDWGAFEVFDGTGYNAATTTQWTPPRSFGSTALGGFAVAIDPVTGCVFLASGTKGGANSNGQVWSHDNSFTLANVSANTTAGAPPFGSTVTNDGGYVAYGLYAGRDGSGNPYLLAMVQGSSAAGGMYRYSGYTISASNAVSGGSWSRVNTTIGTGAGGTPAGPTGPIIPDPANAGVLYAFDQNTGIWRGTSYGRSWTQIWAIVNNEQRSGAIAANPAVSGELWVSYWTSAGTPGGLFKISGANTISAVNVGTNTVQVSGVALPGGVCFAPNGDVYCLSLPGPAPLIASTQLMCSQNGGTTWFHADNGSVAATASYPGPGNMIYTPSGRICITNTANILTCGYPAQPVATPTCAFAMGMTLSATASDVSGPTKNAAAALRMAMTLSANGTGGAHAAAAQVSMALSLTTSGGGQALIVQQVNGSSVYDYGISTVEMATTAGNCLVVLAGWDLSSSPVTAPMPAVNVADSAGNYWQHAGTTTAGVTGARCAAWICPDAQSITWLSVSLTTFCSSLAYTVLEVSGMPSLFALDVAAAAATASGGTLALKPGPTSDSGFAFTVLAAGAITAAPPVPAGWNALTSVTSTGTTGGASSATGVSGAVNPVHVFPYFRAAAPGTSLNTSFTLPQGVALAGVTFCARQTTYPPYQQDPTFPVLKVEAGFGYTPGDPSQAPPQWVNITSRCMSKDGEFFITAASGRAYEFAAPEAGALTVAVDNHDGAFTPGGPNAYPGLALEIPVRVSAYWNGSWYPVAFGWVERWPQEWPDLPQWGMSKMAATDAISVMAAVTMVPAMDADVLLDAPYLLLPAAEQYLSYSNGLTPQGILGSYNISDAQGLAAQNVSRSSQRAGMYVDGVGNVPGGTAPAIAQTGQTTALLGTAATGFGTTAIGTTVAPAGPLSGPGILYTDPNLPSPLSPNGVTVSFWVIIPAAVTVASLQPTVFTAYGPPTNYPTGRPSLSVQILNLTGTNLLQVTLADGSTVTAPFSVSATAQRITLCLTSSTLAVYVNGALAATAGLGGAQASTWAALSLGCPNYAYGAAANVAGNFTAFGLAVHACQLPVQRIVSEYNTGISGQQNAGTLPRIAQILSWAGLGLARAGRVTFSGQTDGILQGPAYSLGGSTAAQAVAQAVASGGGMVAAMPGGEVCYISRWALVNQSPVCVLGDSTDPTQGMIPFQPGQSWGYDNTYLANIAQTAQSYGPSTLFTAVAADQGSEQAYFPRAGQAQSITTMSAQDATDSVNWGIAKYSQPSLRVATVTIDAATAWQQAFPAVLTLRQGQVATVTRSPAGGTPITQNCLIQKITHSIGAKSWKVELQLSPYSIEANVLQLDAAGFDVAGSNTLA